MSVSPLQSGLSLMRQAGATAFAAASSANSPDTMIDSVFGMNQAKIEMKLGATLARLEDELLESTLDILA